MSYSTIGVVQCNFLGRGPSFGAAARGAAPPAAHLLAALGTPCAHGGAAQAKAPAVSRAPDRLGHAFRVPPEIRLESSGGGQVLPPTVREKMERFFAADFSAVRIHVDSKPESIGAVAFTRGAQIHFAPGRYSPHTPHGQRLLGHELTHVVQQSAGRVGNPFHGALAVVQDPGLEAEAERMGLLAVRGALRPVQAGAKSGGLRSGPGRAVQPFRKFLKLFTDKPKKMLLDVGHEFLQNPKIDIQQFTTNELGSYDPNQDKISISNSLKDFRKSTLQHEKAHYWDFKSGMMQADDSDEEAQNLFFTELKAKRREMLRIHDGIQDGWKPQSSTEEIILREYELCKSDYNAWLRLLLNKYAKHYQGRFFDVKLSKVADEMYSSMKDQGLSWDAKRTGWND